MALIKKTIQYQGLDQLVTYINDTSRNSPDYFNLSYIPGELHAGRNIIKIKGNNQNLRSDAQINIEILDSNNEPVYYEIPKYVDDDGSRIIVIYIYDDTAPGDCEIYMISQAKVDTTRQQPVPREYADVPNIKWTTKIPVFPDKRNNTDIIFLKDKTPTVKLTEIVRPYLDRRYSTGQFITQTTGKVSYKLNGGKTPTLTISGAQFIQEMNNASITIWPTGSLPAVPPKYIPSDTTYRTKIKKVLTTNTAELTQSYQIPLVGIPQKYSPMLFTDSNYTIKYEAPPSYSLTENSRSFAFIELLGLEPAAGDINRVKTFVRSRGSSGTWELVDDTVLASSDFREILIDTGSSDVKTRLGKFLNQGTVTNYWRAEVFNKYNNSMQQLSTPIFSGTGSLKYDTGSLLPNSMHLYLAPANATLYPKQFIKVYHSGSKGHIIRHYDALGQYELMFDAAAVQSDILGKQITLGSNATSSRLPYLEIYMSGSSFDYKPGEAHLGKKIGELDISSNNTYRYDDVKFTFQADKTGNGTLIFKVNSGEWYFSEITLKPILERGFNPCQISLLIPVNTEHKNDQKDFKFEYYDYQNKQSKTVTQYTGSSFKGGNTYIGGGYNLLTGSLFVASSFRSGVEITGKKNGGYIRSIGYQSYRSASRGEAPGGFLIWSGSVLENETLDPYNAVGLELHGGSGSAPGGTTNALRFRTDTGKLEVTGAIVATSGIFNNYAVADFLGSNVIVVDSTNAYTTTAGKGPFFKDYYDVNTLRNWTYLDLSGAAGASAMYVRFSARPRYPLTHIKIPTISGYDDNKIGGLITFEFTSGSNAINDLMERFYISTANFAGTTTARLVPSSSASPAPTGTPIAGLYRSNAIRNLSGSFAYNGWDKSFITGSTTYRNLLVGKPNARYVFTKGDQGYAITAASNFDKTQLSTLRANIARQYGTRRNLWIPASQLVTQRFGGSGLPFLTASFDSYTSGSNTWQAATQYIQFDTPAFSGGPQWGYVIGSFIVPEYVYEGADIALIAEIALFNFGGGVNTAGPNRLYIPYRSDLGTTTNGAITCNVIWNKSHTNQSPSFDDLRLPLINAGPAFYGTYQKYVYPNKVENQMHGYISSSAGTNVAGSAGWAGSGADPYTLLPGTNSAYYFWNGLYSRPTGSIVHRLAPGAIHAVNIPLGATAAAGNKIKSGQLISFRMQISSTFNQVTDGSITLFQNVGLRLLGIRVVFDTRGNFGGFSTTDSNPPVIPGNTPPPTP